MTHARPPLVLVDTRPARRRPTSGTATYVRELRRAIEAAAPNDLRVRWVSGPPGVPRRGRLTSAANAALDLAWTHVALPLLAVALRARLIHGTFHWSPWASAVPTSVAIQDLIWEHLPDEVDPRFRRFASRFTRHSAKRARIVIVPSQATADDLVERYRVPKGDIRVVPLGVHVGEITVATREPFILGVGIDEPRKRIAALIDAHQRYLELAPGDPPTCRLVLVGSPGQLTLPRGRQVEFVGRVDDAQLADLYRRATLLVFPSAMEGFGLPILEAMANGCPVLTSRNSSLVEVGGDVAVYLDDLAPDAFGSRLNDLLADRTALADRGRASRAHAAAFSWDETARKTLDALREAIAR